MFKENKGIFGQYREVLDKAKQERGKTLKGHGIFNVDDLEKIFSPDEIKNVLKLEVGENERGEQERHRASSDSEEASIPWTEELKEAVSRKLSEDLSETEKKTSWREDLQNLVARKYIKDLLEQEKPKKAINGLKNKFDLSDEQIQEAGEEELREKIKKTRSYEDCILLKSNSGKKPEVEVLPLPKEKIEEVFFQETERALSEGNFCLANNIKYPFSKEPEKRTDFVSPENIFQRSGIQEAFFLGLSKKLSESDFEQKKINIAREIFSIPEEKFSRAIEREIVNRLSQECIDEAIDIKKAFPEFSDKLDYSKIEKTATDYIVEALLKEGDGNMEKVKKLRRESLISEEKFQETVYQKLLEYLRAGEAFRALIIKEKFVLPEEKLKSQEIQEAVYRGLLIALKNGNIYNTVSLIREFSLPKEKLKSQEIQEAAFNGLLIALEEGNIQKVLTIKEYMVNNNIRLSEHSERIMEVLNKKYPKDINFSILEDIYKLSKIGPKLANSMYQLSCFSYTDQIKPIIDAQGESAFLYFEAIKKIPNFTNLSSGDVEYIVLVAKKYNTQARNILENILIKASSISEEKEIIEKFIEEIEIIHFDVYQQYRDIDKNSNSEELRSLKEQIKLIKDNIYRGQADEQDFGSKLYSAISFNVFPPATGTTQEQYIKLNQVRSDRRSDVPSSLDKLQYQAFEVSTGKYFLGKNEELELEEWDVLCEAIKKVNQELKEETKIEINELEISEKLIKMFKEKSQNQKQNKSYLLESMYRYHLKRAGGQLPESYETTLPSLMQYKEFIGDRIKNDLIRDCLSQWRVKHLEEFEELERDISNRIKSDASGDARRVISMLSNINKKQKDEAGKQKAINALNGFLKDFGLNYEKVKDNNQEQLISLFNAICVDYSDLNITPSNYQTEEYYNSTAFIEAYDQFYSRYDLETLVYKKISSDLVSGINKNMGKEVSKFEFKTEGVVGEKIKFEFVISKKKEHGVAGYNMGVCVTPDEELWNDPTFMNCIIFNPKTKQAQGGMHFLIRENCLCLPGVNPSLELLSQVKNDELFDQMITYAKQVAKKLKLEKVLIPKYSGISSNRLQIHEILRSKNYAEHALDQIANFAYSPHSYSFEDCLEV